MLEHDQRMTKELRKEFGRASDHSTLYQALMKLWKTVEPSSSGPATDWASLNIKMGVVTKNATGRLLKDLSADFRITAAVRLDVERFDHELSIVGSRDVEDAEGPETNKFLWMVAAGKQFDRNMKLFK